MFRISLALVCVLTLQAEDWPEWRGKGRAGVWNETGILTAFPKEGLTPRWRTPVKGGFAGLAVADGRVFVVDFVAAQNNKGVERIHCLDESTGKILWTRQWDVDYIGLRYNSGPRATPTVDGDRVYALGAMGALVALQAKTGEVIWKRDFVKEFGARVPVWGMAGAPIVDGDRLIALVGGEGEAKYMAFDKRTGKELWRALSSESAEPGYGQPLLVDAGGKRQLILWHPQAVSSLNPATGKIYWEEPFRSHLALTVATPVVSGARLFVTSFYSGPMMLQLDATRPAAKRLWKGTSDSEIKTDGLHSLVSTPAIDGDYIYGICSYGQFRCLRASTGERIWETQEVTMEKARWATGFLVRNGDRYFINNDRGDLIIAKLSPEGYSEISRAKLIKPTSNSGNRRELGAVNWSHPAYANRHILARNDEEIISVSLAKP
ncbi:MAG: PQQ-binding-like beta-propeller repeat protein [Bryobacteraceae bacterium]